VKARGLKYERADGRVLDHVGLPSAGPGFHPARPPPQLDLPFDDGGTGFEADPPSPDDYAT
jgi:hypothetical protein